MGMKSCAKSLRTREYGVVAGESTRYRSKPSIQKARVISRDSALLSSHRFCAIHACRFCSSDFMSSSFFFPI
jgi:hypothetical protein